MTPQPPPADPLPADPAPADPDRRPRRRALGFTAIAFGVSVALHVSALALLSQWMFGGVLTSRTYSVTIGAGAGGRPGALRTEDVSLRPPSSGSPALQPPDVPPVPTVDAEDADPLAGLFVTVDLPTADLPTVEMPAASLPDVSPGDRPLSATVLETDRWLRRHAAGQRPARSAASAGRRAADGVAAADRTTTADGTGGAPGAEGARGTEGAGGAGAVGTGDDGDGGGATAPLPLAGNAPPLYPESARRAGEEGTVVIAVSVGRDGLPLATSVAVSSGSAALDAAALDAVAHWRFAAAVRSDEPAERAIRVPIQFRLRRALR